MSSAPEAFERWWQALPLQNGEITADHIRQAWDAGVLLEREACAKLAETAVGDWERDTPGRTESMTRAGIAAAIRSRT